MRSPNRGRVPALPPKKIVQPSGSPDDPDIPGMAFAATTGTSGDPDLDLCREFLVPERIIDRPGQSDRILFAIPAHVRAKAGLYEFYAGGSLGFCKRAETIKDSLAHPLVQARPAQSVDLR